MVVEVLLVLFHVDEIGRPTSVTDPRIATPFGLLETHVVSDTLDTQGSAPAEQSVLSNGTDWRRWTTDAVAAEVLVGPFIPKLPVEMGVAGCQAVIWRVQAVNRVKGPAFCCRWCDLPTGADGGPDSGEGLDALTWSINSATMSLGTEDGEYLAARAYKGHQVPGRLMTELSVSTVEYLPDGLRVPFSSLQAGELVQVHFIIAWDMSDDPDRCDTWYAVAQSPSEILRQFGVK